MIPERNSFVNDDLPTYVADSAFVPGWPLVARFRKTPIPLGGTTRVSAEEIISASSATVLLRRR
ncbi:MAG: hypothetical protein U0235_01415 [Polyangiaceae bacterium]